MTTTVLLAQRTSDLGQIGQSSGALPKTTIPAAEEALTLDRIRKAIPKHCFEPSATLSAAHIILNVTITLLLATCALRIVPLVPYTAIRWALWLAYGYVQGLLMTGIWILGHECGHQALFKSSTTNDVVGFILHSALLVPYFSWKYTHGRHHRYTNNMAKDTAFVPTRAVEQGFAARVAKLCNQNEDAPLFAAALLLIHQLAGWPLYLFAYVTGGEHSLPAGVKTSETAGKSHFNPNSVMWLASQKYFILLSDAGLLGTLACLWILSQFVGPTYVFALHVVPYLWVNNWLGAQSHILQTCASSANVIILVAITYLHHTHPDIHHFEDEQWTYLDGSLGTVDRPFGFVGKHIFHGIIDFHVVHHLFS